MEVFFIFDVIHGGNHTTDASNLLTRTLTIETRGVGLSVGSPLGYSRQVEFTFTFRIFNNDWFK